MEPIATHRRPDAGWHFDNSYTRLPEEFYARLNPTPVRAPKLVVFNEALARSLGLNPEALKDAEGAATFSGNRIPAGAEPIAQAYAGHQFGHFTMLGDGRAILLGEQVTPEGERFDIQFKGSGKTPFSRRGDGRAALGPMLREYIISEALCALGIPTTRSLAVVTTGEPVYRETVLPGAILTRVASSHLRVGTFEYAAARGATDGIRALADYTIDRHFPELADTQTPYLGLFR
ncbi:MAG: protein adenylyltransferase SelO family protein, partial [Desulfobacterales bacterium]